MFSAIIVAIFIAAASIAASAQNTAILTNNNNCLIPDGNRQVKVFKCTDGGVRYTISGGVIKTSDGYCFDHGIPLNQNGGDRGVKLVRCHGGTSQTWWVITSGRGAGLIQNAANWQVCLNIEGGNDSPGARLIVWPCGFNNPGNNERFFIGGKMTSAQLAGQKVDVKTALSFGRAVTFDNGTRMVAAGGGNMVAAGAGNMVAAGGGNVLPTAGGNMVAAGSLNLIGNDGLTIANSLVGNDGASLRSVGFRVGP